MSHTAEHSDLTAAPRRLKRLEAKPTLDDWADHEALTLTEAIELDITGGALSAKGLRTAVNKGEIASAEVAGRIWITKRAVREAFLPKPKVRIEVAAASDQAEADVEAEETRSVPKPSLAMTMINAQKSAGRVRRRLAAPLLKNSREG